MALPTAIAVNQTAGDILIDDLGLTVPASSQITLTDFVDFWEVSGSQNLETEVTSGNVLINDGVSTLTLAESQAFLDITGNLNGPTVATAANQIAVFSDTTGRYVENSNATLSGGTLTLSGNILPNTSNTYDIGSNSNGWQYMFLSEESIAPTTAAGIGAIYVKDDTPSTLHYVDDAGTDFTLLTNTSSHTLLSDLAWTSSGHTGTASTLAAFTGGGAATNVNYSSTPTASYVVQANGSAEIDTNWINYDDVTITNTSTELAVKAGGIAENYLGFSWATVTVAASSFSYSAPRSTYTLGSSASSNANVLDMATLYRNGVNDQTRVTTTAASNEWSISGTTLSIHGDITSSGDTYKVTYVVGTAPGGVANGNRVYQWVDNIKQNPLEPETDYFDDGVLDAKWEQWNPDGTAVTTVTESGRGVSLVQTSTAGLTSEGIIQPAPTDNDFLVTTKIRMRANMAAGFTYGQLIVGEDLSSGTGNPTTGSMFSLEFISITNSKYEIRIRVLGQYNSNPAASLVVNFNPNVVWLRWYIDRIAETATAYYSADGFKWLRVYGNLSWASGTVTSIDSIGLAVSNFNSGLDCELYSDCFRVDITDDPLIPTGEYVAIGGGGGGGSVTYDTYDNAPGSPSDGALHITSDGPLHRLYDVSAWQDFLPGHGPVTAPPTTGWTNLSGATNTAAGGCLDIVGDASTGTTPSAIYRSAPTAPYTITIGIVSQFGALRPGFYKNSVDDAVAILQDSRVVHFQSWTTTWTSSLSVLTTTLLDPRADVLWIQLEDDNTDLYIRQGPGPNGPWEQMWTAGRTAHISGGPDAITIGATGTAKLVHYEEA